MATMINTGCVTNLYGFDCPCPKGISKDTFPVLTFVFEGNAKAYLIQPEDYIV